MVHRLISNPLWIVVMLALVLRTAVIVHGGPTFDDPDNYLPLARSIATGQGFVLKGRPTAYRPPLYPLMLAPLIGLPGSWAVAGIALLHVGLGTATVWLTGFAAERFGLSRRRAAVAALITACDPVLLWQCRSVMTETMTAFLIAATLAGLTCPGRKGAILGGLGFGLASLCRPSVAVGFALTLMASLVAPPGDLKRRILRTGLLASTFVIVLSPWMVRNWLVFGEPIWSTTHGGYTLALANNPVYYREVLDGPPGQVWSGQNQWTWWDSVNRETAGMSEPEADRHLRASVVRLAAERPGDFLRAIGARLGHFWSLAPANTVYPATVRGFAIAWTLPLWIAMGLGLLRRPLWRWPPIAAPMIIAGLTLVHAFFWTDMRMRAPIVPAIALIAAGAAFPALRSTPGQSSIGPGSSGER